MKKKIDIADRRIIERIVTVKEWNATCRKDSVINYKSGYVMPLYHGHEWRRTKRELIKKYTFAL
jgi:hypothetical protein